MDERLEEIAQKMEELIQLSNGDPEAAHGRADDLLTDVIDKLMTKDNSRVLTRILEAYDKIEKWYS